MLHRKLQVSEPSSSKWTLASSRRKYVKTPLSALDAVGQAVAEEVTTVQGASDRLGEVGDQVPAEILCEMCIVQ